MGYNNSTNNIYNISYDLKANPFIPKNILINQNMSNNINSTNNLLLGKNNLSWICSYCQNYNSQSKYIKYIN